MSTEPMTEAGKALLSPRCTCGFISSYDYGHSIECPSRRGAALTDIAAIENEAREQGAREERERIADGIERLRREARIPTRAAARLLESEVFYPPLADPEP